MINTKHYRGHPFRGPQPSSHDITLQGKHRVCEEKHRRVKAKFYTSIRAFFYAETE